MGPMRARRGGQLLSEPAGRAGQFAL